MINGVSQYSSSMNGVDFSAMRARREEMFTKMDTNSDGSIDKAELTSFLQQLSGTGQTPPNAEDMLSRMDTDSDGKISKTEFEKGRHEDMFAKMDTNSDGSIDKAELTSFGQRMSGMGPAPAPPNPDEMFSRMDTDSDGKISKTEFDTADPRAEKQTASAALSQSGLASGATAASLTTLLNSLVGKDKETDSLFSSAIQQYAMSVPSNMQSILDLLG